MPKTKGGKERPLIEREIKLRLGPAGAESAGPDDMTTAEQLRSRLAASDAVLVHDRAFEDNVLFDRDAELLSQGIVLRLRLFSKNHDDSAATLTFKGPSSFEGEQKIREEVDLGCASGVAATAFLEGLGYRATMRYQKFREIWSLESDAGAVEICLDETPIGDFVELELVTHVSRHPDPIESAREALGLETLTAEVHSYPGLYAEYRARNPNAPADMVFEPEAPGS